MKKYTILCLAMFAALLSAMGAEASPTQRFDPGTKTCRVFGFDSGWWGTGGQIWRETCKACHTRDNDQGASFLHTESKSPTAWNRVFLERYPQCAKDGQWDSLTMDEILQLNDYLYRYGANTYDANDANDCG
jgi:hypothetical protein